MRPPTELSEESHTDLLENGFTLIEADDGGMYKSYIWTNGAVGFALFYDRGYYDCQVYDEIKKGSSFDLVWLLRFIHNDRMLYEDELKAANSWNTLSADAYVELFCKELDKISYYFQTMPPDAKQQFEAFVKNIAQ
jgi:hypothetical protein